MKSPAAFLVACVLVGVLSALLYREMQSKGSIQTVPHEMAQQQEIHKPETVNERMSYGYGMLVYGQLTQRGYQLDLDQFINAVKIAAAGKAPLLNEEEMHAAFLSADQELAERTTADAGKKVRDEGETFLKENAKRDGVITTASGLQYEILKSADGPKPTAADVVMVHYHGTLIDGTVFDSSVLRGEPASFPLYQVIKGWTEGITLMSKGAKYKFYIPNELGYGAKGSGDKIKPYSVLIFEVELMGF